MCKSKEKEACWRLANEEQRASGLTVRAFCEGEAVSKPSFQAWRKQLRDREEARAKNLEQGQNLVRVDIVDSQAPKDA